MAPGDKDKLDGYPATPDDLAATLDLQAVTDNGNTTTNGATFGDGNISLNANGNATFSNSSSAGSIFKLIRDCQSTRRDASIQFGFNNGNKNIEPGRQNAGDDETSSQIAFSATAGIRFAANGESVLY